MRRISADLIFPLSSPPVEKGIILLDDHQKIIKILKPGEEGYDLSNSEYLNGWIVPGWINAHGHLELSHLKNKIPEKSGLDNFVDNLMAIRSASQDEIENAMVAADEEMRKNGIVFSGDISNGSISFSIKEKSLIEYYTFIERFGFDATIASNVFQTGKNTQRILQKNKKNNRGNLSIHAPYSISEKLFDLILKDIGNDGGILSVHNQESISETTFFLNGNGEMLDRMLRMGLPVSKWNAPGISSMKWMLKKIPADIRCLFVHNTYTRQDDLIEAIGKDVWFCMCPGANLFIEDRLPDIDLFREKGVKIVIGTDSLASNFQLDILEELKIVSKAYPHIPVEELFSWGSLHGAEFYNCVDRYGSIEPGKKPGLVLIKQVDLVQKKLLPESKGTSI